MLIAFIAGLLGGFVGSNFGTFFGSPSEELLVKEYYDAENAVAVSPHTLRTQMHKIGNEIIIIDVRSREDYEQEHIVGALNIPGFSPDDASADAGRERIIESFKALGDGKEIITYCYSGACMLSRQVGQILASEGIFVKHLNIGWQEWKYFWNLWNSDTEEAGAPAAFTHQGPDAGVFKGSAQDEAGSCVPDEEGKLSC